MINAMNLITEFKAEEKKSSIKLVGMRISAIDYDHINQTTKETTDKPLWGFTVIKDPKLLPNEIRFIYSDLEIAREIRLMNSCDCASKGIL